MSNCDGGMRHPLKIGAIRGSSWPGETPRIAPNQRPAHATQKSLVSAVAFRPRLLAARKRPDGLQTAVGDIVASIVFVEVTTNFVAQP